MTPFGRLGGVDEVATALLFLASDESRFITAVNLPVDGGCAGAVTGGMQGEIA